MRFIDQFGVIGIRFSTNNKFILDEDFAQIWFD